MSKICVISVGKLKSAHWQEAAKDYITRLRRVWQISEITLRDGYAALSPEQRSQEEGIRILNALNTGQPNEQIVICLDEQGKDLTSLQFANFLSDCFVNRARYPCFVIGGAYGLDAEVKGKASHCLRLSAMTFTHELAQVVLWEQLYRAQSILNGSPYHH